MDKPKMLFLALIFNVLTLESKIRLKPQTEPYQQLADWQKNRVLTFESAAFNPNYVVVEWLKKYNSRNSICYYLCQQDSLFSFGPKLGCYKSYNCDSMIWQSIFVILLVICYGFLPLLMILLGIWNFKCLSQNIAILTGINLLSYFCTKLASEFQDTMQTDYDISSSQAKQLSQSQSNTQNTN